MIQYKCPNCGGEMEISGSGGFACKYCGSKTFLKDVDFKGNEIFRKKLLSFYKAAAESKELDYNADTLWECNGEEHFTMKNGQDLSVKYMYKYDYKGCICFVAKENAVYVFENDTEKQLFLKGIQKLVFPEADAKLHRCFPNMKMEIALSDGREVLVFLRRPNFFPAELFSPFTSEHLAWVISRMENICCELKYSEIEHGGIDATSIWINPITHEGALFGDWRKVKSITGSSDLEDLRKTAIELAKNTREPIELYDFLNSKPEGDAYEDFTRWNEVIEKGFGGHKFVKM